MKPLKIILDSAMASKIKNNYYGFYGFQNTKTTFHLFTSQPITRNALQCNDKGSFCYGRRNIFLGSS